MHFVKMQGTGNDFIIIDNRSEGVPESVLPTLARRLCTRRLSIGADALMAVDFPRQGGDLQMRFYNADGSEGEMCGNGARCLARFALESGLSGDRVCMETMSGNVLAWRHSRREYEVRLNPPTVLIPDYPVDVNGVTYDCAYVELGSPGLPHAVVPMPGLAGKTQAELRPLGMALRHHPAFRKGANVNFYDWENGAVRLLTYERGVEDFTLACGTGSGSTSAVLAAKGLASDTVHLIVPGGTLRVRVQREGAAVTGLFLIGDTNRVAEGEVTDEDLSL